MTTSKERQKRTVIPREKRGLRYPVEFVAAELGVDRKTLERRCEASGFHLNGAGLKFCEAYDALSQKSESESAIRRKRIAEAESAEIETMERKGATIIKTDHKNIIRDWSTKLRVHIESAVYIPIDSRRKLIQELAEIKPSAE